MKKKELAALPDYQHLKDHLEQERNTIIKVNSFADDEYVRSIEDAKVILDFLNETQVKLYKFFEEHPNLIYIFHKQFGSFNQFISRNNVLELSFLDDCLFPNKEQFFFGQDGGIEPHVLELHTKAFDSWMDETLNLHKESQDSIRNHFTLDKKIESLPCRCLNCHADFKTRLRETIYQSCLDLIQKYYDEIDRDLSLGIEFVSDIYYRMQKDLDKKFHSVRKRLKRSSLNRLENQVRNRVKDLFNYPSELSSRYVVILQQFFQQILIKEELNEDLVTDDEFDRFFRQLSGNLWRNERYLTREFKKLKKSVLLLKRKDISATILKEYLGEFWTHSDARTIKRKIVYHMGPTNSGKTYHAINALCEAESGCYLAPLRLLAGELYDTMNQKGVKTSLLTGEEVVEVPGATHYSSTIEMAKFHEVFDCAVIDEIQMISDNQRGWAWTRALVNIYAKEIHICGDGSVLNLIKKIVELCGDELEVQNYERMTRLTVDKKPLLLGDLERSDALIVFSRRNALKYKFDLEQLGFKVSIVYGRLSPEVRREQARKFDEQETDIIVSTDAIAMGMNLPIKRIVFSTLSKFINSQEYPITESEIKQIAGRAGRYKRFPVGHVNCLTKVKNGLDDIRDALKYELPQKKKCMVGPDLDIFKQVNNALEENNLPVLQLSEFLRLFNTMTFQKPFFCVELQEMIELAEMVEEADPNDHLSTAESFGFTCAPVNLGLLEHVQYFVWILNHYVNANPIVHEDIESDSDDIDYLETSIKCVELYQWLSRHFGGKHFDFDESELLSNKSDAIEKLNTLLSKKIVPTCSSCGVQLAEDHQFNICENCFKKRRFKRRRGGSSGKRTNKNGDNGKGKNQKGPRNNSRRKKRRPKRRYNKK